MFWPVVLLTLAGFPPAMVSDDAVPGGYPTQALCRARLEQMVERVRHGPPVVPFLAGKNVVMATNCIREKPQDFFKRVFGNDGDKSHPDAEPI